VDACSLEQVGHARRLVALLQRSSIAARTMRGPVALASLEGCMPDGTMLCDRPVATDLSSTMTAPPSVDFLSSRLNFWPVVSCT